MLLLTSTSDLIQVITSAAADIEVHASWVDNASGTITPGRTNTPSITSATTTTVVGSPAASTQRNVKLLNITNNSTTVSCVVEVQHTDGTTTSELCGVTLLPGENLVFTANGDWVHHDTQAGPYAANTWQQNALSYGYGITGTLAENIPRHLAGINISTLTSGTLWMQALYLFSGQLISNISFASGATGAGTPTNRFFALYDQNRSLLAQTANQTTSAWGTNTLMTTALTSPYRIQTTGLYYIGVMVTATTVPTLAGFTAASNVAGLRSAAPVLSGASSTSLTTSLPSTAAAITASPNTVWCAVT